MFHRVLLAVLLLSPCAQAQTRHEDALATGALMLSQGRLGEAEQAFRAVLTAAPNADAEYAARWALAELYAYRDPASAAEHLRRATALRPDAHRAWLALGEALGRTGRYGEAISAFSRGAESDPRAAQLGIWRARVLLSHRDGSPGPGGPPPIAPGAPPPPIPPCAWDMARSGPVPVGREDARPARLREVEECFAIYLWMNPTHGAPWADLGEAWMNVHEFGKSVAAFERAVAYAPDSLGYHVRLGWARFGAGDAERATAEARRLVSRHPGSAEARLLLGRLLALSGDAAEALPHLERAAAAPDPAWEAPYYLGDALMHLGDYAAAVRAYRAAHRLVPRDAFVLYSLVFAYLGAERFDDAAQAIRDLRVLAPELAASAEQELKARRGPVPPPVLGEGWTLAEESSTTEHWALTRRATRTGGVVAVWSAKLPREGQARAFQRDYEEAIGAARARRVTREMVREEVDCSGLRARSFGGVAYDASGDVVSSWDDPYPTWRHPVPGSVLESLVRHVCAEVR